MATTASPLGGKGINLLRLSDAGFPVPQFVVIDTEEYDAFVAAAHLQPLITTALKSVDPDHASDMIRAAFSAFPMPTEQRRRLIRRLGSLMDARVAIRSSATAEDLEDASFAGQQDSFLEVSGVDDIMGRIIDVWSSLWTARAIAYRRAHDVSETDVSIAVVVQRMVDADASGVLFTTNPLTGRRDESVIEAISGLGGELVAGHVMPDTIVAASRNGSVRERTTAGDSPALTDAHVADLVALGQKVAGHYGAPQDIEWVRSGDQFWLVQSRAITTLFPLPDAPVRESAAWVSFGAFQGMLAPIHPLGQDTLRALFAGGARAFGRRLDWRRNTYIWPAAERLWVRADGLLHTGLGRTIVARFLQIGDPAAAAQLSLLGREPEFARTAPLPSAATVKGLAGFGFPVVRSVPRTVRDPEQRRLRLEATAERYVADLDARLARAAQLDDPSQRLQARVAVLDDFADTFFLTLLPRFAKIMGPTLGMLIHLRSIARKAGLPDADALVLSMLGGLPGNVTVAMDLALSDVADAVRSDATSRELFAQKDASDLAAAYMAGELPPVAQDALASFLDAYGMRGVAEIDLGAPRWRDDPQSVLQTLKAQLSLDDPDRHPRVQAAKTQREGEEAVERLAGASRLHAAQVRLFGRAIRGMFGARETPKLVIVRCLDLLREAFRASASELVDAGRLDARDDVFFLRLDELRNAFASDWHAVVAERKESRERELRRPRVPRVMTSDGRTFYDAPSTGGDLTGMGVSPGVVEGTVRVVLDPRETTVEPGEVLVCPGTDPAWTPLFLTASALITEVGGLMTHGSVVAREYGIPAVVGVSGATTKLTTGQRIRVDGATGVIDLL